MNLWNSLQGIYVIPALLLLFALLMYFGANSLFVKLITLLRSAIKGFSIPLELVAWPFRLLVACLGFAVLLHYLPLPLAIIELLNHSLFVLCIVVIGWFVLRALMVLEQFVLQYYAAKMHSDEASRKIATHVSLARKLLNVLTVLLTVSGILMTFDTVRQVGLSILASAGILSVMLGFAAQKSLTTLISGIQIAITQPISIGDEVVVENEKGVIEEITLTYVVVQLWDQRRMIVPITWFIDRPFQNWSRTSPELLGTLFFYLDYALPLEPLRQELERLVAATPLWDKRVAKLQVTNTSDRAVEVRVLVSAANSSALWDLRCLVREELLAYLRLNYPGLLPRMAFESELLNKVESPNSTQ